MRTVFGTLSLTLGCLFGFGAAISIAGVSLGPGADDPGSDGLRALVATAFGGWAGFAFASRFLLFRARPESSRRRSVALAASTVAGVTAGLVSFCLIDLHPHTPTIKFAAEKTYELHLQVFGMEVRRPAGPGVEWTASPGAFKRFAPPNGTEASMLLWVVGAGVSYAVLGGLIGGGLGGLGCRLYGLSCQGRAPRTADDC